MTCNAYTPHTPIGQTSPWFAFCEKPADHDGNHEGAIPEHPEFGRVLWSERPHEWDTVLDGPIPMRLHCPQCHELHVDQPPYDTKPHHTHACQRCGHVWRPATVPTVGVQFLPGFADPDSLKPPRPEEVLAENLTDRGFTRWEVWTRGKTEVWVHRGSVRTYTNRGYGDEPAYEDHVEIINDTTYPANDEWSWKSLLDRLDAEMQRRAAETFAARYSPEP